MPIDRDGQFFEGGRPIRVEGGIAVRAQRGSIGEHWWSRRFVDILEEVCPPGRLTRGRAYARKGQVLEVAIEPGLVTGVVQGSRDDPYEVAIEVEAFSGADWTRIERE